MISGARMCSEAMRAYRERMAGTYHRVAMGYWDATGHYHEQPEYLRIPAADYARQWELEGPHP